ncbi:putative copper resistance protein CRF1 [Rhizopus microsporus]
MQSSASCIRGHRVKKCNHTDRQLFPVLKRGRQISQCTHCRDLRKTKQIHIKCTCAVSSAPNPITGCLCEVILTCSCVSQHHQDIKEDQNEGKNIEISSSDEHSTDLRIATHYSQHINSEVNNQALVDNDLLNFLINDLDKHIN